MVVYSVVPISMTLYFRKFHSQFRQKRFIAKFGELINDLSFRAMSAANYFCYYCYRRLIFAILIVFVSGYPYAQLIVFTIKCLVYSGLMGYSDVYRIPKISRID